jgi:hypothetical protein
MLRKVVKMPLMRRKYDVKSTYKRPNTGSGLRPTAGGGPRGTLGQVKSIGLQPSGGHGSGISPAAQKITSHAIPNYNSGVYHGQRQVFFTDKKSGVMKTNLFHIIEAIEGTWLSAACREHGWGAEYGPEDGYGAYVEGIIRREDGSYFWPSSTADRIEPSELFAIEIYKGKPEKDRRRKSKPGKGIPDKNREKIEIDDPTIEMATIVGLAVEVAGNIFPPVALFVGLPLGLISMAKSGVVQIAELRALCYATTAFTWMEHERKPLPLSRVFQHTMHYKLKDVKKAWNSTWINTVNEHNKLIKSEYRKIYMEVSKAGGDVSGLGEVKIRKYIKAMKIKKHKTAAQYCDRLMDSSGEWWKNRFPATIKPIWELHRKTKYPT